MIDIHSHVLPGIDDGSEDMEMSLDMLAMAAESGVDTLVATPHCNIPGEFENYLSRELEELFLELQRKAERAEIPLRLCRGMEIYATPELPELLKNGRVWTLNGGSYFLTEFNFGENPDFCSHILKQCERLGYRPIIAHPERYYFLQQDPELAYEWCTTGYGLQINKGSLLGRFGLQARQTAALLLEHGLAACVASDAHRPYERTTHMGEIKDYLDRVFGEDYRRLLLEENPSRILDGRELLGYEPIPFY